MSRFRQDSQARTTVGFEQLRGELRSVRVDIIRLMLDEFQQLLMSFYDCETWRVAYRWSEDVAAQITGVTEPDPDLSDLVDGPRVPCPLCGGRGDSFYTSGYKLEEGLRRHLVGYGKTRMCSVMSAARLRQLAAALPSDASSVTLTRADLLAMLEGAPVDVQPSGTRDMSVEQVAEEVQRSPSTIRRWLIAGELRGYKLQGRDWRVPRPALRNYLARQARPDDESPNDGPEVNISAWRSLTGPGG